MNSGMHELPRVMVKLLKIDFDDTKYKISKNIIPEFLARSISAHGILQEPILLNNEPNHTILTGHNRLKALIETGATETLCFMTSNPAPDIIKMSALLKMHHGTLGPIGKLKYLSIMSEIAPDEFGKPAQEAYPDFNIPAMILRDSSLLQTILNLPDAIKDYVDIRDIGYKTICELVALPDGFLQILSEWINKIHMRVNVFRETIDILHDLSRRGDFTDDIMKIDFDVSEDVRGNEFHLLNSIRKLRYPQYEARMEIARSLIAHLAGRGVRVEFPPFFEGDSIGLTFTANKKEGADSLAVKTKGCDLTAVQKLLDLL